MDIKHLTRSEFTALVADPEQPVTQWRYEGERPAVIDFYAPWCGPCRALAPLLDEAATAYENRVRFYKVNVDEEPDLTEQLGIRTIPTLFFVSQTGAPEINVGGLSKARLFEKIDSTLDR